MFGHARMVEGGTVTMIGELWQIDKILVDNLHLNSRQKVLYQAENVTAPIAIARTTIAFAAW